MVEIIGYLVAAHPGVWVAPVFYKRMEIAKNAALSENCGNFDAPMRVPDSIREDLLWWTNNVDKFPSPVQKSKSNVIVKSDASKIRWGAECLGTTTGGMWTADETSDHINCLELKAALFALQSLCKEKFNSHIQLQSDNSTTVACITIKGVLNQLVMT